MTHTELLPHLRGPGASLSPGPTWPPPLCRPGAPALLGPRPPPLCPVASLTPLLSTCSIAAPLALLGIIPKAISLLTSDETWNTYYSWKEPLPMPFPQPQEIKANYFFEAKRIEPLRERGKNLEAIFNYAIYEKLAPQLLEEILSHLSDYLCFTEDSTIGNLVTLPLFLDECACANAGYFNRFKNGRRASLEKKMIQDAERTFPSKETLFLNYMSLGSGNLLQDFINIGLLIQADYPHIDVSLIDPILERCQKGTSPTLEQFNFLLHVAEQKGINLNVHTFSSITDYVQDNPSKKHHIISAIDFDCFDKAFSDILTARKTLDPNGTLYLAYGPNDRFLGKAYHL